MAKDIYTRLETLLDKGTKGGKSRWQVFNDFLTTTVIAMNNAVAPKDTVWQERENQYLSIIGNRAIPRNREYAMLFAEMLVELIGEFDASRDHYTDVLGTLFHRQNFQDEWQGQFFTPSTLSDISAITLDVDSAKEAIKKRGFVSIHEPATGGGAMLLAIINRLASAGINPRSQALFVANDIDIRCVYMSYLQLDLAGVPAIVYHKDTLTDKELSPPWYTPVFVLDGWFQRVDLARRLTAMFEFFQTSAANEPKPRPHFSKKSAPKTDPAPPKEPKYEPMYLF